jgi:hypothetical protein
MNEFIYMFMYVFIFECVQIFVSMQICTHIFLYDEEWRHSLLALFVSGWWK